MKSCDEKCAVEEDGKGTSASITPAEAGRRGGNTVREKYGADHFRTIGKKGGQAVSATRGREFYREIGRRGAATVQTKYGREYYQKIGSKGGQKVRDLIAAGKAAAAGRRGENDDGESKS